MTSSTSTQTSTSTKKKCKPPSHSNPATRDASAKQKCRAAHHALPAFAFLWSAVARHRLYKTQRHLTLNSAEGPLGLRLPAASSVAFLCVLCVEVFDSTSSSH